VKDTLLNVPHNCKIVQFVDDIVIFCQNKYSEEIYSSLAEAFDRFNSWLFSINLELSIPKTQFIIFNRAKKMIFPEYLEIRGNPIIRRNTVKYLDIQLDAGLRWRDIVSENQNSYITFRLSRSLGSARRRVRERMKYQFIFGIKINKYFI